MRSTSAVPRVISQLENIVRMHHPTRNNYCILHNEQCEKPRRKSSEDRITCFLPLCYNPLVEPRLRIRLRRIRSLCLQIILVILALFRGTRIPDPLFPHLVPPAIMVWIFVWKYICEPLIHILQHFVLQLFRSTNFCFLVQLAYYLYIHKGMIQ
jgi:hypothetical protein